MISPGARLFDDGKFFEAHEAWEKIWLASKDEDERRLYQGLIQIAAGFLKLLDKSAPDSAERLLAKGLAKLDKCPPEIEGIDLAAFRDGVRGCSLTLTDRALVPKLLRALA